MFGLCVQGLSPRAEKIFESYGWPGNVRELKHCIEHVMNMAPGPFIDEHHLPLQIRRMEMQPQVLLDRVDLQGGLAEAVKLLEKEIITSTLQQCAGNISRAARCLRLPRQTLQYKLKNLHIPIDKF